MKMEVRDDNNQDQHVEHVCRVDVCLAQRGAQASPMKDKDIGGETKRYFEFFGSSISLFI
jgi:hypothetical protein